MPQNGKERMPLVSPEQVMDQFFFNVIPMIDSVDNLPMVDEWRCDLLRSVHGAFCLCAVLHSNPDAPGAEAKATAPAHAFVSRHRIHQTSTSPTSKRPPPFYYPPGAVD